MWPLCFEPLSCAVALSTLEHALQGPRRACPRAKVWLRRAPGDLFIDATLGEASDPFIDALNLIDSHAIPGVRLVLFALVLLLVANRLYRSPPREAGDVALGVVVER
jgi:hypothetical protein